MAGWVYLDEGGDNQITVYCEDYEWNWDDKTTHMDYPLDGHYGFSLKTFKRIVTIKNIFFENKIDFDNFIKKLKLMQASAWNLRIKCSSTGDFEYWDDGKTRMPVLFNNMKGAKKAIRGDSQFRQIKMLKLRQAGPLAA